MGKHKEHNHTEMNKHGNNEHNNSHENHEHKHMHHKKKMMNIKITMLIKNMIITITWLRIIKNDYGYRY